MKVLWVYLCFLNLLGLVLMFSDKERARRRHWRIPEKWLFIVALAGGSAGSFLGMWLFRHKTRHWYFVWGMGLILLVQIVLLVLLMLRFRVVQLN